MYKSNPHQTKSMARLIRAWKVKIRRAIEPGSKFDFWRLIDIDREGLAAHIRKCWEAGMTWENYGTWQMRASDPKFVVKTLSDLYDKFHYTNYAPYWARPQGEPTPRL